MSLPCGRYFNTISICLGSGRKNIHFLMNEAGGVVKAASSLTSTQPHHLSGKKKILNHSHLRGALWSLNEVICESTSQTAKHRLSTCYPIKNDDSVRFVYLHRDLPFPRSLWGHLHMSPGRLSSKLKHIPFLKFATPELTVGHLFSEVI